MLKKINAHNYVNLLDSAKQLIQYFAKLWLFDDQTNSSY